MEIIKKVDHYFITIKDKKNKQYFVIKAFYSSSRISKNISKTRKCLL
jgi:hypothetical protein